MWHFKCLRVAVAAGFLSAFSTMSAGAATITFSQTLDLLPGGDGTSSDDGPGGQFVGTASFNAFYTLPLFNPSLGTLNSVTVSFDQSVVSQIVDTGGNCAVTGSCAVNLTRTITQSGGGPTFGSLPGTIDIHTVSCNIGGIPGVTPDHCADSAHTRVSLYNETFVTGPFADYIDAGFGATTFSPGTLLDVEYEATALPDTLNVSSGVFFTWSGTATVTYDFTASSTELNAPAGAAFLLIGASALARRKRP